MKNNLGQKILECIEEKHITPKPKWNFVLKDSFIWGFALLSLIIGAMAFAVTLHTLLNQNWELHTEFDKNLFQFILISLPYFWILFLFIFITSAYYNFVHTKNGYRYRLGVIVTSSVLVSILVGTGLYALGIAEYTDETFAQNSALYRKHANPTHHMWEQPEHGHLSGRILHIENPIRFVIEDPQERIWTIHLVSTTPETTLLFFSEGKKIKELGHEINSGEFEAKTILPSRHKWQIRIVKFEQTFLKDHPPISSMDTK